MVVALVLLVLVIINAAVTGWLVSQHGRIRDAIRQHDEVIRALAGLSDDGE